MVHASLFSGIGGPEVAAAMMGWENAFHCEINPFGRAVLDCWFPENGIVLDPFIGSGTTGLAARILNRNYIGIEINPEYKKMAEERINNNGGYLL